MNLWYIFISIIVSYGLAIAFVEKGNIWPVRKPRIYLQVFLNKIHWRLPLMLFCDACTSFWMTLLVDIVLFFASGFTYFLWPLSGFATMGATWTIIDFLNSRDKE